MAFLHKLLAFPRLLVAGKPKKTDLALLIVGTLSAIASGVPFPLIGILFGQLLNEFNGATCDVDSPTPSQTGQDYQTAIDSKILIIVYLAIAQAILIYTYLSCWSLHGARLAQRLREGYLENLLRQEPSYFDSLPAGEVASRLDSDIQTIRSGTSEKVGICISSLSFFITAYVVAFIKDARLAAMLVSLVPAYFLMSLVGGHYIEKYSGLMSEYAATAAATAAEALSNVVVVHAFGANARLEEKFSAALKASEHEGLKKAAAVGTQAGLLYFIAYGANGLAFWQGSKQIADAIGGGTSGATVGAVFTVIFILVEATLLLSQVAPFLHLFTAAIASFDQLRPGFHRESLIDGASSKGLRLTQASGTFDFQDVSFVYPARPEIKVLDGVSFQIPSHKHTAIVGLSGSGKSTIASLVTRLYDPEAGKILFDGNDLREINPRDLRGLIGLVQQEPSLLDRSILENIAHGILNSPSAEHDRLKPLILGSEPAKLAAELRDGADLDTAAQRYGPLMLATIDLVRRAADRADANAFIASLRHGYGTVVGSAGRLISGGQKQRIALARALVKDPAILILDEATAALDSLSEQRIQRAVSNLPNSVTVLTIAHRLSTVIDAENIIVMHAGRIIQQGTHSELVAEDGAYANFVRLQGLGSIASARTELTEPEVATESAGVKEDIDHATAAKTPTVEATSIEKTDLSTDKDAIVAASEEVTEPETPSRSLWSLARGYAPILRPHVLTAVAALLSATIVGGAFSAEAVIFGNTVGSMSPCDSPASIRSRGDFFGLMFFVLAIIELFANFVSWTGFGWVSEKTVYTVRVLSFRSLFEQDLQWHQSESRTPALLLSFITRDGNALAGLSGSVVGTLFSITVNLIAAIILTVIVAWRIALVCLALVPLLLGAGLMELRVLGRFEEQHASAYTKSVDLGVEAATNIKTVACLSLEDSILRTYRSSLKAPQKETLKVTLQASFWQTMMYFLGNCVNALAYWWGAKQIIAGNYTQTQFLIVVFSLLVSALLWSQTFALAPELASARGAMVRILGLIELGSDGMRGRTRQSALTGSFETSDIETDAETKTLSEPGHAASGIKLQNIGFSYPARPDVRVLNGLSMEIQPGQFCALVGPSGSGKSTIISLIERMYVPQSGSITINGSDITQSRDVGFRDAISLVPQESVLFEGSVMFNVGLGAAPGHVATMDEIEAACRLANIHDVIEALPQGYDTLCGPNGNQFSGGQKQRLSIARALVRRPKILILDEPTSALDAESERLLQEGLDHATSSMTVIAIAHRLNTIKRADVIFLIDAGRCVDHGTHDELLERSDSYRANVQHQTIAQR